MTYLKIAWKIVSSRPAIAVAALVFGIFLSGHVRNWKAEQKLETVAQELERTKEALKAERGKLTREEAAALCAGLQPIVGGKALETSRKRRPPATRPVAASGGGFTSLANGVEPVLLDVLKLPTLEHGGEAEVTLAEGAAAPVVTVYQNLRPWFEVRSRWRAEALIGQGKASDAELGRAVAASLGWTGLRTGRVSHGAGVAGFDAPGCPMAVMGGYKLSIE